MGGTGLLLINKNTRELPLIAFVHLNIECCIYTEEFPKSPKSADQNAFEILIILSLMSLSTDHFFHYNLFTLLHNCSG